MQQVRLSQTSATQPANFGRPTEAKLWIKGGLSRSMSCLEYVAVAAGDNIPPLSQHYNKRDNSLSQWLEKFNQRDIRAKRTRMPSPQLLNPGWTIHTKCGRRSFIYAERMGTEFSTSQAKLLQNPRSDLPKLVFHQGTAVYKMKKIAWVSTPQTLIINKGLKQTKSDQSRPYQTKSPM